VKLRGHHLHEECLFECYLTVRGGDMPDPPVAEHIADCHDCGKRYADLARFMEGLSTEAASEGDAVFTPERLRLQRQQIARRIEHLGHPARVITFPSQQVMQRNGVSTPRPARRWIAAAAAAGLFIGVGTGILLDWERTPSRRVSAAYPRQTVLSSAAVRLENRPDPFEDNKFLSELELAGDRPRIRELSAIDALTPHVREITLR
jgi:hypothetical protein